MDGKANLGPIRQDFYQTMIQRLGGKHEVASIVTAACDPSVLELQNQVLTKEL